MPVEVAASLSDRMRRRIMDRIVSAPPPAGTVTYHAQGDGWLAATKGIQMKMLRVDAAAGTQELLVRFSPEVEVPAHSHLKEEQMIVLEGECHIGDHPLRAGDIHIAPPGSWHPLITSRTGALLLLRCEYPFPVSP